MQTYPFSRTALAATSSEVRDLLRHAQLPGMISMAGGLPAPELFDLDGIARATSQVLARGVGALQYSVTEGQPALRAQIATRLHAAGAALDGHSIVVTTGSQQALDLLGRTLLNPGDTVIVESPTYLAALQAFSLSGARYVSIDQDEQGAVVEDLEQLVGHAPKMVYVVTNFANPSGRTLSLERRLRLLEWAARHRVMVIEDDPYGELRTDGEYLPSLLALSTQVPGSTPWVGLISTLSKTVSPGFRVGWMVLPEAIAEVGARIKQAIDLQTSTFVQEIAAAYLASGDLEPHLEKVRVEYRRRRRALCDALNQAFGETVEVIEPDGGMFVWARFRDGTNTRTLFNASLPNKVCFVPGDVFYSTRPNMNSLRLNFSASPPEVLSEGVQRIKRAHRAMNENHN